MKTWKQMVRQPIKTLTGLILVALAVAILVTCVGQYSAAALTRANLDDQYDTLALLSSKYFRELTENGVMYYGTLPEKYQSWIDEALPAHPDLVKMESRTEGFSAYVPGISPDNYSKYATYERFTGSPCNDGNAYRCAMLEVTLTEIGTKIDEDIYEVGVSEGVSQSFRRSITMLCAGTVESVIGLEPGFASPLGQPIVLMVRVCDEAQLDALELEAGQRYLVYGMDFTADQGYDVETAIINNMDAFEGLFGAVTPDPMGFIDYSDIISQIRFFMTVCDDSSLPIFYFNSDASFELSNDWRENWTWDGELSTAHSTYIPAEEYIPNYRIPTIVKLEGSAESYLESEEGALWKQTLDEMEINHHGFPVLAVDKLGYQVAFARGGTRIVEGRDFTEDERTQGSKVCVISQNLAAENGLSVGDTIRMQTYGIDPNIRSNYEKVVCQSNFPSAAVYSHTLGFTSEMESYTIVGIYRQQNAWKNQDDNYGFTPNTIFVPKGSTIGDAYTGDSGIFYSLVLHNGKMEEFKALQEDAGYPGLFICMDQGYSQIDASLDAYQGISGKALWIGIGAYAVVMLLFLVLFPLQQRRTLAIMGSLGAPRAAKIRHVFASSLSILIPGGILGGAAAALLWDWAAAKLMAFVNVHLPLESNILAVAPCLAAAHMAWMALVVLCVACLISGSTGMGKKS